MPPPIWLLFSSHRHLEKVWFITLSSKPLFIILYLSLVSHFSEVELCLKGKLPLNIYYRTMMKSLAQRFWHWLKQQRKYRILIVCSRHLISTKLDWGTPSQMNSSVANCSDSFGRSWRHLVFWYSCRLSFKIAEMAKRIGRPKILI